MSRNCWTINTGELFTVNPRNSPHVGLFLFLDFCIGLIRRGGLIRGGLQIFLVVGYIPVEIFLLIDYFFKATHRSNRMLSKWQANFR